MISGALVFQGLQRRKLRVSFLRRAQSLYPLADGGRDKQDKEPIHGVDGPWKPVI
jgi:hypothetical protein